MHLAAPLGIHPHSSGAIAPVGWLSRSLSHFLQYCWWSCHPALRYACFREQDLVPVQDTRFQPAPYQPLDRLDSVELFKQGASVDSVEAFLDVGVEDVFGFESDVVEDGFYGIVSTAPWPESV
jgi:hypothetical protein